VILRSTALYSVEKYGTALTDRHAPRPPGTPGTHWRGAHVRHAANPTTSVALDPATEQRFACATGQAQADKRHVHGQGANIRRRRSSPLQDARGWKVAHGALPPSGHRAPLIAASVRPPPPTTTSSNTPTHRTRCDQFYTRFSRSACCPIRTPLCTNAPVHGYGPQIRGFPIYDRLVWRKRLSQQGAP